MTEYNPNATNYASRAALDKYEDITLRPPSSKMKRSSDKMSFEPPKASHMHAGEGVAPCTAKHVEVVRDS